MFGCYCLINNFGLQSFLEVWGLHFLQKLCFHNLSYIDRDCEKGMHLGCSNRVIT